MPPLPPWPRDRLELLRTGVRRCEAFARLNGLPMPGVYIVEKANWYFGDTCAFYSPERTRVPKGYIAGINICPPHCGRPCGDEQGRNWSWPGSVIDRTTFGVICHEFAHHLDWVSGTRKGKYFSDFGEGIMRETGEPPVTNYAATNPAEWFAEACRIYVTNPPLLRVLMPKTYLALRTRFKPLHDGTNWQHLMRGAPARVIKSIINRGVRAK